MQYVHIKHAVKQRQLANLVYHKTSNLKINEASKLKKTTNVKN